MDGERLRSALAGADLRVLLMVVFHLSGDRRWLEAPFQPRRDVNLIAAEDAGLAREEQDEIRAAAHALLSDAASTAAIGDPGDALMVEMMSVCLGERVPEEYAPMMREELGFTSRDVEWPSRRQPAAASQRRVLIVGAGASGIAMGARLGRLGIPYLIVERNSEVGGTWFENRYPGCGVDTPNHAYSFSFGGRYPWSRYFSPRGEIQDYLVRCADEFGVRPNIRFATAVTSATWDESTSRWNVGLATPEGDDTLTADFLVTAIGQFGLPSIPELDGIDRFRGASFHSAAWPDALDVTGRRVAILGTGASAMQIAPTIADRAASLTLYQRSAQWARPIPRYRDSMGADAQWLLASVPFYAEWFRFTMLWRYGDGLLRFLRKDPDWPHPDRSLNRINDRHRQEMTDHIASELAERSDLIPACVPTYPPYGKRILLDNGWYTTLTKLNVELVTDAIDHVDELGIATRDGSHRAADIIVYATGFQMTQMASRLNICGREGLRLDDAWADENPTAYLGISVPGMPNLFLMQGPNSGLGHGGSAIFLSECQARYITGLLLGMIDAEVSAIDVRREVHDDYVQRVDAEHEQLIWTHPGMSTYYRNRHGRVVSVMPWRLVDYWAMTHDATLDDYELTLRS
ncbi:MAG: NAD(P)/FAD-dependent oxidoreductase [Myxococcales bacterium]|nr:NAD(P)/FAD-dependent oxidoreductase [Myxococcales bacterium]